MKKIGSIFSNRTKVIGGMTILLGIATGISIIKDNRDAKGLEAPQVTDNATLDIEGMFENIPSDDVIVESF